MAEKGGLTGRASGGLRAATVLLALVALDGNDSRAQAPRNRSRAANPAEVKRLDSRLEEVQSSFVRETSTLLGSYEAIGQFDRVKTILEAFLKLDPKNEQIKARLAEVERRILEAGEYEVRLQAGEPWQPVGVVTKDRPIRVRVTGDYRFQAAGTVTADGLAGDDPQTGIVSHAPFGAVIGVIVPPSQPADAKMPRPFLVGSSFDRPAERDGVLHLRTNIPVGTKCTGRLDLLVSGPQP